MTAIFKVKQTGNICISWHQHCYNLINKKPATRISCRWGQLCINCFQQRTLIVLTNIRFLSRCQMCFFKIQGITFAITHYRSRLAHGLTRHYSSARKLCSDCNIHHQPDRRNTTHVDVIAARIIIDAYNPVHNNTYHDMEYIYLNCVILLHILFNNLLSSFGWKTRSFCQASLPYTYYNSKSQYKYEIFVWWFSRQTNSNSTWITQNTTFFVFCTKKLDFWQPKITKKTLSKPTTRNNLSIFLAAGPDSSLTLTKMSYKIIQNWRRASVLNKISKH